MNLEIRMTILLVAEITVTLLFAICRQLANAIKNSQILVMEPQCSKTLLL